MIKFYIVFAVFIVACQNYQQKDQSKKISSKKDNAYEIQDSLFNTFIGLKKLAIEPNDTLITLKKSDGLGNDGLLVQIEKKVDSIILTKSIWSIEKKHENQDSFIRKNPLGSKDILYKNIFKKEHITHIKWNQVLQFLDKNNFQQMPQYSNIMYIDGTPIAILFETNSKKHYVVRWHTIDSLKPFITFFEEI